MRILPPAQKDAKSKEMRNKIIEAMDLDELANAEALEKELGVTYELVEDEIICNGKCGKEYLKTYRNSLAEH